MEVWRGGLGDFGGSIERSIESVLSDGGADVEPAQCEPGRVKMTRILSPRPKLRVSPAYLKVRCPLRTRAQQGRNLGLFGWRFTRGSMEWLYSDGPIPLQMTMRLAGADPSVDPCGGRRERRRGLVFKYDG